MGFVYFVREHIFCYNRVVFALNETFFATLVYYRSKSGIFHDFLMRIDFALNKTFLLHWYIMEANAGLFFYMKAFYGVLGEY
jgi:hypothetical protein